MFQNDLEKMDNIFENCYSLKGIPDVSKWNIKKVDYLSFSSGDLRRNSLSLSQKNDESEEKSNSSNNIIEFEYVDNYNFHNREINQDYYDNFYNNY